MRLTSIFYNRDGISDVLIIDLLKDPVRALKTEGRGDWVMILDEVTDEVMGYNLFQASSYFSLDEVNGKWSPSTDEMDKLNKLLSESGIEGTLEVDQRPDFLIGIVESKESHPDADKLNICQVSIGKEKLQIVCGAPNVEVGQKVVVARVGALMPDGSLIKDAELRGVPSSGMICSARELELPNAPQKKGIHVLSEEASVGTSFWDYYAKSPE